MPEPATPAERRFVRYLEGSGRCAVTRDGARWIVERDGQRVACAVASVDDGASTPVAAYHAAARRLQPLAGHGLPCVAVLANATGADVVLSDWAVRHAMLGDRTVARPDAPAREHAHVSAVVVVHERAHADDWHDQVEALLLDEPDQPDAGNAPAGAYQWVEVFEIHHLTGAPALAREVFAGERDQWFGEQPGGVGYGFIGAGRPAGL